MKLFLSLALVTLSLIHTPQAWASNGGRGGGGIHRDKSYLVFGDVSTELNLPLEKVEGLSELLQTYSKIPFAGAVRSRLKSAAENIGTRRYFNFRKPLDKKQRQKFITAYKEALGLTIPDNEIVIYAFTDKNETYLLPEFYLLSDDKKERILFHESLWVINPGATYKDVMNLELEFDQYLKIGTFKFEPPFFNDLAKFLGLSMGANFVTAARVDLASQCLPAEIMDAKKGISLSNLFGPSVVTSEIVTWKGPDYVLNVQEVHDYAEDMRTAYPCSLLFQELVIYTSLPIFEEAHLNRGPRAGSQYYGTLSVNFNRLGRSFLGNYNNPDRDQFTHGQEIFINFANGVSAKPWQGGGGPDPFDMSALFHNCEYGAQICRTDASGASNCERSVTCREDEWRKVGQIIL